MAASISVIIPTLNEADLIAAAIRRARAGGAAEVIVADGGSADGTAAIARSLGAAVVESAANRGAQQNLGALLAAGPILLFLHADTEPPVDFAARIRRTLAAPGVAGGAFRFRLDGSGWQLRLVERVTALRCKFLQLPYGDQAIFVAKETFERAGRFPDSPVMEDFDFIVRLKKLGRVAIASADAVTSARRWRRMGVWRMTWINQLCIFGYYLRIPSRRMARWREPVGPN